MPSVRVFKFTSHTTAISNPTPNGLNGDVARQAQSPVVRAVIDVRRSRILPPRPVEFVVRLPCEAGVRVEKDVPANGRKITKSLYLRRRRTLSPDSSERLIMALALDN
ncbi:hypothetical protein CMUS01_01923 [Colletotrichum musicola]|uniref:Uncharacterized protein n=1 Tax=Colletotrichum musicola TaxID=2175873 RepID=A0A8H6U7Z4_9PEZI|nr:hypothetical protein CMUS01_01923 [Colletotrichum musicola]